MTTMNIPRAARTAALGLALATTLAAQTPPAAPSPPLEELETILVTGEQPGPGLWKVSKEGHVLWILGSYTPLPKDMRWRSKEVEARIAASQEVLYPGAVNVGADIGILRGLTLLPAAFKAAKNPDGAKLKDVLPADTYEKWRVLKQKYLGRDEGIEEYRPTFAASRLRETAIRKNGLSNAVDIRDVVNRAAKQHRVRIHTLPTLTRKVHVEDPRGMLKDARRMQLADAQCFRADLDRLEPDIEAMKQRANAWARGNVALLRSLARPASASDNCMLGLVAAVSSGEQLADQQGARRMIEDARRESALARSELEQNWLDAAQAALAKNIGTFAVLPMESIGSYTARLRDAGYAVEEPE